jgi:hypothetical protein
MILIGLLIMYYKPGKIKIQKSSIKEINDIGLIQLKIFLIIGLKANQ